MPLSLANSRIGFNFDIMPLSIRDFKQIELVDKPIFDDFFRSDPPAGLRIHLYQPFYVAEKI